MDPLRDAGTAPLVVLSAECRHVPTGTFTTFRDCKENPAEVSQGFCNLLVTFRLLMDHTAAIGIPIAPQESEGPLPEENDPLRLLIGCPAMPF